MEALIKLKNNLYVSKKEKIPLVKEILRYKDTQIFGGWNNQFIAYNRNQMIFSIYERTGLNNFNKLDIYFNEFAEQQIEEFLELWDTYAGHKDIEKFIILHFHKSITIK
ncbi:hypothetical protein [Methylophilus methylotrophus]|uniref:hypothetical protein n=1 Tax=Methylophilus methylotrophus TaxID=17 RepID=UPI00037B3CFA|nr:hypothetical protein [Methylophilus methylotrophus]